MGRAVVSAPWWARRGGRAVVDRAVVGARRGGRAHVAIEHALAAMHVPDTQI
jgi:hypothetical protein